MSRTCQEIREWMNHKWPEHYACSWDNVGLLVGSGKKEVKTVYLALDATWEVIQAAKEAGADMLITHHPMIFGSLKKINDETSVPRRVMELIGADISYYASHTSFDIAPGGMADLAGEMCELFARNSDGSLDVIPLEQTGTDEEGNPVGVGKTGNLKEKMTARKLAEHVKKTFGLPAVILYAKDPEELVERAAISPGSGKSMAECAVMTGAKALITGDMGHHDGLDMVEDNMILIDAGHYGLEHIFIDAVGDAISKAFPDLAVVKAPISWPYEVI